MIDQLLINSDSFPYEDEQKCNRFLPFNWKSRERTREYIGNRSNQRI